MAGAREVNLPGSRSTNLGGPRPSSRCLEPSGPGFAQGDDTAVGGRDELGDGGGERGGPGLQGLPIVAADKTRYRVAADKTRYRVAADKKRYRVASDKKIQRGTLHMKGEYSDKKMQCGT